MESNCQETISIGANLIPKNDENIILTEPKLECTLCGRQGKPLYSGLRDRLFGVPGEWALKKCSNTDCGLVWLDPAPCKGELWKAYATYYTHQDNYIPAASSLKRAYQFVRDCYLSLKYGYFPGAKQSGFKWLGLLMYLFPGRRADVDFSIMYLPNKPEGRLLEIGCGSGSMLSYMSSLGWRAEGIDFDPAAVSNAQCKGLKVTLGSLGEQHFDGDLFDAIMISHVIEHVPDPLSLIEECYRILKPGGILSIVTPNIASIGSHLFGSSWLHLDPPRHLVLYNCGALQALAKKSGFADIKTGTTIRDAHALYWASYSISRHGAYIMGSMPGRPVKSLMLLLRLVEWLLIKIFPRRGEEISLTGIK